MRAGEPRLNPPGNWSAPKFWDQQNNPFVFRLFPLYAPMRNKCEEVSAIEDALFSTKHKIRVTKESLRGLFIHAIATA